VAAGTHTHTYSTPGQALAGFLLWASTAELYLDPSEGWSVTGPIWAGYEGAGAIILNLTFPGIYDDDLLWIATDTEEDQVTPARPIIQTTGVGLAYAHVNSGTVLDTAVFDYLTEVVIPMRNDLIEQMSGGTFLDVPDWATVGMYGGSQSWTNAQKLQANGSLLVIVDSIRLSLDPGGDAYFFDSSSDPDAVAPGITAVQYTTDQALTKAVNSISDQDVEASFNQGQTAYSIKAKITAGP
jgi:hypothetical protein